ncbi:hypothetical protein SAMN05216474_0707 [Lishizhenia tianjinensis]|uniref:SSD domain-containing protein n=1 Tax=Lishizhenia tianjinensis TaxID=477690 RepID=A0A1I6Y857_9FLAO|nr:efflux RND transporter permease subunit [Lishizhenia tianjinensis]SFT46451.1 hypothetical protein SAMN05216474_0707 [Lishizhenia tianjinensis]
MKKVGSSSFKKLSFIICGSIFLLTVLFSYQATQLQFNYNFEEFFPANDEEADYFYDYRQNFSTDNDFILISVENKGGIFNLPFLEELEAFRKEIEELDLVKNARAITNEQEFFVYKNGKTSQRPYISWSDTTLSTDSTNIYENKELLNTLVSHDAKAAALIIQHQNYLSKVKSDRINRELDSIARTHTFDKVRMSGRVIGQKFYIDTMTVELRFFLALSILLIILVLWLAFRSLWGLILPLLVIVLSLIWILGIMSLLNEPINILLTVLPSIMFVVGMSDVIHFVSKYIELLRQGIAKNEAIRTTLKEVGLATFLTSLTTAVGFFSLFLVEVKPVQKFGMATGIGVFVAFILTFSLLPILFYFTKTPKIVHRKAKGGNWYKFLHKAFAFTLKRRKQITLFSLLFLIICSYGASLLKQDNFLMDDLKESSAIKQNFNFLDDTFGGVRPFELAIEAPDSNFNFFDKNALLEINTIEKYLTQEYGVNVKLSLPFVLSIANRSAHAGDTSYFKLPQKQKEINTFYRQLKMNESKTHLLSSLIDSTSRITRISGTLPDLGNIETTGRNKAFYDFIEKEFPYSSFKYKLASTAHILDKNMSYLSGSLVKGLLLATLIVALIMGLLFKDFKMVVISIIPNILPLVLIAAVMGYFGIELKITTAIVYTISFGIAVDDTIHFLSKFKLEMNKGKSVLYAIKRSYLSTGRAIILTSIILCSGFLLLIFSDFLGTVYMGMMISITLVSAVIADLFILPLLLLYFYKKK